MPRRDRSGPRGMGPLTGWGRGDCGETSAGLGRGLGRGGGAGYGRRRGFRAAGRAGWMGFGEFGSAALERQRLEIEAAVLKSDLEHIQARLLELRDAESD